MAGNGTPADAIVALLGVEYRYCTALHLAE
jgi:aminoglycoside N3'-acetyltransferase